MKISNRLNGPSAAQWAALLSLLLLAMAFAWRRISGHDIGFQIAGGDWIIRNLRFPAKDMFSTTAADLDYIDLHWIYQVTVSLTRKLFGEFGLVAENAVLIAAAFFIAFLRTVRTRKWNELAAWQIVFFLGIWSVAVLFELRPHTFSWIYFNLLLLILDEAMDGRRRMLWLVPVIMLLWANTHSLFVLGWLVLGCYVVGSLWTTRTLKDPLIVVAVLSVAAPFLNPYGVRGVMLPFIQFGQLQAGSLFKETIKELASPLNPDAYMTNGSFVLFQPLFPFHLFLLVSFAAFFRRLKRVRMHELLLFLFFAYLGLTAVKNIGFFIFAALPMTIDGLSGPVPDRPGQAETEAPPLPRRGPAILHSLDWVTAGASVILITAIITNAYYINFRSNDRFGYRYNNLTLPVEASGFLREHHLDGTLLNHFDFGGFFIQALPQKVSIDGRNELYGDERYARYSLLWALPDKKPILEQYNPDIVAFPHHDEFLWVHYLTNDTTWRLAYVDELAAIYLRRGYADSVPAVRNDRYTGGFEPISEERIDGLLRRNDPAAWSLLPPRLQYFPQVEFGLSNFCYFADRFDEAVQMTLNGMLRCTVPCPEAYYNLGHYFFEKKDYRRSAYCYGRFLLTNFDPVARQRLDEMRMRRVATGRL